MESHSGEELQKIAAEYALQLVPKASGATLVTLRGELGAGKTTFVQGVAKALDVGEVVTSPTFVLEKIYKLEGKKFTHLVHIDAYRLKGAHELEHLGWEELLKDSGNLIVLEWPERVAEAIPEGAIRITFDIAGDGRIITIDGESKNTN
ncbi:tRNA (adenosine(37)-N6)-threonylcarbamoyltransferase complex ATPase subunit type 1 TsaE [Candidatus Kaiserbacteria bacterium CG10_big_fil_rev_8_21_14_0_10_51_14]|uniref:tRNA threonylcarbamoyladenosine biosynthesis protein TsaE n=1 Tax=Candidatus Kaiserbacteria bacterium CG10_big_fil_rev_8_21_14_0_10_51_14 TaxID=1974610 RepID=A0A2H0UCL4_9BACT|nr:MAG: tRNA (adenosine(37)-N6)-threonylcarbamoyltransferase complex ATPase subunit type 1 TsaE [Candidatus Kaiserbacteria bacterium CG10_big_fil_rev_8_21_14_0_10_51_14]